jgi:hypothetical protein
MIRYELTLALLLVATSAAADPTPIEKSTADALFRDAKTLMEKKQFDAACPKLAESHRLQPGGGVVLALAICHEGQGRLASAWNDYREALALALRDKRKDREDAARSKIAELEPRISRLTIRATNMNVTLDGVALSATSFGTAIPIDGGTHVIEASAEGHVSRKTEVTVGAEKDRKEVDLPPLEVEKVSKPEPKVVKKVADVPAERHASVVPYVVGGAGLVALGIGGYFGVSAIGKRRDVNAACPGDVCTDPAMVDRNDEARRAATISNIAIGIGIVAVGAAVVLIVVDHGDDKPRVTAGVGPGSVAMEVTW